MQNDYTVFNIPARAFAEARVSDTTEIETGREADIKEEENKEEIIFSNPIYGELNKIAEELEECRLRNC